MDKHNNQDKDSQPEVDKPVLKPTVMSMYPTMNSLQEAVDLADSKLPLNHKNALVGMLYIYHNTLLKVLSE